MTNLYREAPPAALLRYEATAAAALAAIGSTRAAAAAIDDLALLQQLFDAGLDNGLEATGYLFGERLRRDLGLHWVTEAAAPDDPPALRYRTTEVVFYPWRMLQRQVEAGGRVQLAPLVQATRDYLANLQRYALGERRPPARHD